MIIIRKQKCKKCGNKFKAEGNEVGKEHTYTGEEIIIKCPECSNCQLVDENLESVKMGWRFVFNKLERVLRSDEFKEENVSNPNEQNEAIVIALCKLLDVYSNADYKEVIKLVSRGR